jgi:hypothetical protein
MTSIDTAHTAAMTDQAHLPEHLRVDRHPRSQREGWPTIRGGKSDHRASPPVAARTPCRGNAGARAPWQRILVDWLRSLPPKGPR